MTDYEVYQTLKRCKCGCESEGLIIGEYPDRIVCPECGVIRGIAQNSDGRSYIYWREPDVEEYQPMNRRDVIRRKGTLRA